MLISAKALHSLRSGIHPYKVLDLFLVLGSVLLEDLERISLGRRFGIRIVEKVLDSQKNLLNGDGWLPCLLLVQNTEANGAGRIHVGMKQRRVEFAFGRLGGIFLRENHVQLEEAALPDGFLLSRDSAVPVHEVQTSLRRLSRLREKTKGVVLSPLLAFLLQAVDTERHSRGWRAEKTRSVPGNGCGDANAGYGEVPRSDGDK